MISTSKMAVFFTRARPLLLIFFGIELLLRGALLFREFSEIPHEFGQISLAFLIGFLYDAAVATYLLAPFLFYLALASWYTSRDRLVTTAAYICMLYFSLIHCIGEWAWWDDIGTRTNYVAWDYLEYPEEVIQMVLQAYHGLWILLGVVVVTPLLGYFLYPRILSAQGPVPNRKARCFMGAFAVVAPLLSYTCVSDAPGEFSLNQHLNEIAKNGVYHAGSTFWRYHLPYGEYFLTSDEEPTPRKLFIEKDGPELRRNVVVVVMESLSADYMAAFGGDAKLTPNLDRLAQEGLFFTNHYACGTRTDRGVEAVSMALPPIAGPSRIKKKGAVRDISIGSLFAERGYDTSFFYNGYGRFDNMGPFLSRRGFSIRDRSTYEESDFEFENLWGVSDEDLFRKVVSEANDSAVEGNPFFHLVLTISNHRPFTYPDDQVPYPSGQSREGAVYYADYAIGRFIEKAKLYPWFEETIFVFVADHSAFSAGERELTLRKHHIPLIFYAPGLIEAEDSGVLASQVDIAPTLAGMLNWSYSSGFYGRDLLQDGDERAFIANFDHLGLVRDGILTVLRPSKAAKAYTVDGVPLPEVPEEHLKEAISIYQTSARF